MNQPTLFVQTQGNANITELPVADGVTGPQLLDALRRAGLLASQDLAVFVDESEEPVTAAATGPLAAISHGARIHIVRCRRIVTTVHYVDKTIEREFGPGARVHTIKKWAAREFKLEHTDAAEHVLQICQSTQRPASDTALHTLVRGADCAVCFDLVPEKRVEG